MVLYGMSLSVFVELIQREYPKFIQSWYADDYIMLGSGPHLKPTIYRIEALGISCGLSFKI